MGGEGGVAPSLLGIAKRREMSGIEAFIRRPSGAMPSLYPAVLTDSDVREIATYVSTLD
jgi:ubiquinol-cytochrome c reductase cytochrome c subunit